MNGKPFWEYRPLNIFEPDQSLNVQELLDIIKGLPPLEPISIPKTGPLTISQEDTMPVLSTTPPLSPFAKAFKHVTKGAEVAAMTKASDVMMHGLRKLLKDPAILATEDGRLLTKIAASFLVAGLCHMDKSPIPKAELVGRLAGDVLEGATYDIIKEHTGIIDDIMESVGDLVAIAEERFGGETTPAPVVMPEPAPAATPVTVPVETPVAVPVAA